MLIENHILHTSSRDIYLSNIAITIIIILVILVVTLAIVTIKLVKENKFLRRNSYLERNDKKENTLHNDYIEDIATDYLKILGNTALLESFITEEDRKLGTRILKKIYDAVYGKKSFPWEKAYKAVSILHDNLPDKLRKLYPELDEAEIRICCLTYLEVNNMEIATIMRFKINTVQSKKSVIRKKLGIEGYGNIRDFIIEDLKKEE